MGFKKTCKFGWFSYAKLAVIGTSVLLGLSGDLAVAQITPEVKSLTVSSQSTSDKPKLSEIIPLSSALSARLSKLENITLGLPDLAEIEKDFSIIDQRINTVSKNLKDVRKIETSQKVRELRLKLNFAYEKERLKKINLPLTMAIEQLDKLGNEWQLEKQQWENWQSSMLEDRSYSQIRSAFDGADSTITSALGFISQQMEPLLAIQLIGARLDTKIDSLDTEMTSLTGETLRRESLHDKAPPMYSPDYYAQYNMELLDLTWDNLAYTSRPGEEFFLLHAMDLGVFGLFLLGVFAVIHHKRQAIAASENWTFVADRPFSSALFIATLFAIVQMQFWTSRPEMVTTFFWVTSSMSGLRLLVKVLQSRWAKQLSRGAMSLFAITVVLIMLDPPSPILNLFVLVASAVILAFALKLAAECSLSESGPLPIWGLRILAFWFAVILIAQILGDTGFAYSMFVNSVISMAATALFVLFIYLLRGGIHWVFFSSPLWNVKLLRSDALMNERKVQVILETVITLFLILPAILYIWNVFDSYPAALSGLFSPGFDLGGQRITVGLIIASIAALYFSIFVSQLAPKILLDEQILGRDMDRGARGSIGHLIRYLIIFVGLLMTFMLLGVNMTNITIILSALGVGIGFGLQGIVNNFVSGLILLFERPIREGDTIVLGDQWAQVKKIGMRATIIETFDLAEMVIPNADIINNHVTNWTLSSRKVRLSVSVGVDYDSDVALVVETILSCAKDNSFVMKSPTPDVLFSNLGESSLDFKLRVWIQDADNILVVKSQLYHEIVNRFREKGITIPFPQRDLHLYGV